MVRLIGHVTGICQDCKVETKLIRSTDPKIDSKRCQACHKRAYQRSLTLKKRKQREADELKTLREENKRRYTPRKLMRLTEGKLERAIIIIIKESLWQHM